MFLGHGAGWWGIVIGIVAIVLTIPLAIVANFITPFLVNELSKRSESSLRARIAKLAGDLALLEKDCPLMSPTENQMLLGILCIARMTTFAIQMFGLAWLGVALFAQLPQFTLYRRDLCFVVFMACQVIVFGARKNAINPISKYREEHSISNRESLRKTIDDLKNIAAKYDRH